jgi:DNA-binding response OmpR family regulator
MARKVLCVEDHVSALSAIKSTLERDGYEVISAVSGQQALDLFSAQQVDGVLLKSKLPDLQSMAVLRQMKRINANVPVLLFMGLGRTTRVLLQFLSAYLGRGRKAQSVSDLLDS